MSLVLMFIKARSFGDDLVLFTIVLNLVSACNQSCQFLNPIYYYDFPYSPLPYEYPSAFIH